MGLVERHVKGFGRTRLLVVPDSSAQTLEAVLREFVELLGSKPEVGGTPVW